MSRIKGDPRQALIVLGPDAPFVDKAAIAICGPDLIDIDYLYLMLEAGRLGDLNADHLGETFNKKTDLRKVIAGEIFIECLRDKDRNKKITDALDIISETYRSDPKAKSQQSWKQEYANLMEDMMNFPQDTMRHIPANADTIASLVCELENIHDLNDEILSSFSARFSEVKLRYDMLNVAKEILSKIQFIKLYMDQAILPIEACILLGARRVNIEKTQRLIQNKFEILKDEQRHYETGLMLSDLPLPFPAFDSTGSEFWRSKRLLLSEWEEMTDPIFLTKTRLRNRITALTGREPSTKDVETSAELIGYKIKSPNKRLQKHPAAT